MKIIVDNCGKSFHRQWLYRGLNFTFEVPEKTKTQSIALLGSNGSGKSTFGLMLLGQVSPTEGRIQWISDDNSLLSSSEIISNTFLISPALELPEELNLREWFDLHQSLRGFNPALKTEDLLDLCSFTKNTLDKSIATFSSGMKQRIKLVAGFYTQSRFLFLDEPLSNLDDKGIELYFHLVANCSMGKLLLVASNRSEEYPFCDTALKIKNNSLEIVPLNC